MNARSLVMATGIALMLTYGMFFVGSRVSFGAKEITEADQQHFIDEAIAKLNQTRVLRDLGELTSDEQLQSWLTGRLDAFIDEDRKVDVTGMLNELPRKMHTVTSAAARTIEGDDIEELLPQIEFWVDGYAEETRIIATRLFKSKRGKLGCTLVAAKKVPQFSLALLNEGVTEFFNTCRHCDEPHLGTLSKVNLALAVSCPHCSHSYDLLAADMLGRYHRANAFLEGMRPPPGTGSEASSRYDEMMALWAAAVKQCRYTVDLSGTTGEKDTWQRPSETFSFRNGDCEDSSLMLADWLLARGFEARVAIGQALGQGGHAWCVVRLDGHQYILETTLAEAPQNAPEPELVKNQYQPQYLFDRDMLYFSDGPLRDVVDYFAPEGWIALGYDQEEENLRDGELAIGAFPSP